jgi:hypothetical protein
MRKTDRTLARENQLSRAKKKENGIEKKRRLAKASEKGAENPHIPKVQHRAADDVF